MYLSSSTWKTTAFPIPISNYLNHCPSELFKRWEGFPRIMEKADFIKNYVF